MRTSRRHWKPLLVVAIAVFVPIGLLDVLNHHVQDLDPDELSGPQFIGVALIAFSQGITALLGEVLFAGVVAAAVSETHGGHAASLWTLLRTLPYVTVISIDILFSLGLALTLLLLIVPGVIFFARYALAAPLAKIEHLGIRDSFKRSAQIARGHLGLVLGVLLSIGILGQVLSGFAIAEVGELAGDSFVGEWAGATLSELVSAPIWAMAAVSLTYELLEHGATD
jgi:hypothetical protein